ELMEASHGTRSGAVAPGSADPGTPADVDPWVAALTQPADRKPRRNRTMRFHPFKVGGAFGAASRPVVGSTVGSPVAGAVVGGAAGATIGAVTAPEREGSKYVILRAGLK